MSPATRPTIDFDRIPYIVPACGVRRGAIRRWGCMSAQRQTPGRDWARRFHLPYSHLETVFGGDWFGLKAEAFARFFGRPSFLVGQTIIVGV
jgi:hypothetical protein